MAEAVAFPHASPGPVSCDETEPGAISMTMGRKVPSDDTRRAPDASKLNRLLVIAAAHTGNNVFTTPALRLIKRSFPHLQLDVIVLNRKSSGVFAGNGDIDRLLITSSKLRVKRIAKNYPFILCLNDKSEFLLDKVDTPYACVRGFYGANHHADEVLNFVAATLGLPVSDEDRQYHLAGASSLHPELEQALQTQVKPVVGIHLGCGKTAIHGWKFFYNKRGEHRKLWPLENYIELGRLLRERFPDCALVITGAKNEAFLARSFAREIPGTINLAGKTSANELFSSIEHTDVFVTHDCGVLHVASATQTPVVGLFGPTKPIQTGLYPVSERNRTLQKPEIADIRPGEVADQVAALIG